MEKHIYTASSKIEAINEAKKNLVETEKNLIITEIESSEENITIEVVEIREVLKFIENYLKTLLTNIGYKSINIEITNKDTVPTFTIYSENDALLIGKSGKNLNALQTITHATLKKELKQSFKFLVTISDYKEQREKSLIKLAKNVAEEVRNTKIEARLDSMNSYERRIIHNTLLNNKYVYTESVGEEPNRYIVIKSKTER